VSNGSRRAWLDGLCKEVCYRLSFRFCWRACSARSAPPIRLPATFVIFETGLPCFFGQGGCQLEVDGLPGKFLFFMGWVLMG
jgi:hypothetical protein